MACDICFTAAVAAANTDISITPAHKLAPLQLLQGSRGRREAAASAAASAVQRSRSSGARASSRWRQGDEGTAPYAPTIATITTDAAIAVSGFAKKATASTPSPCAADM